MFALGGFPGFLLLLSGILGLRNAGKVAAPRSSLRNFLGGLLGFFTAYIGGWVISAPLLRNGDGAGFIALAAGITGILLGLYLSDRPDTLRI
jgi:hypothetical protein